MPPDKPAQPLEATGEPKAQKLDLDRYVFAILTWITQKMSSDASRLYRECHDIGISEWRVLAYLGIHGQACGAKVADFQGIDRGLVSRSASHLRKKGYVEAVTPERREVEMRLTPDGITLYNKILRLAMLREEKMLDGLSADERETLIGLLHRLHNNIPKVVELSEALARDQAGSGGDTA